MPPPNLVEPDWDRHQREIWRLYLIENKPLEVVMNEMKQRYAFSPGKQRWVEKLKQWGCYKNINKKGWRFISHQTRKRKLSGAEEEPYVVLAGVRLSLDQVQKGIRNHCPEPIFKLPRHRSPSPPSPTGLSLRVYTPPPLRGMPWSQNLPWLQFHHEAFQAILTMLEKNAGSGSPAPVATSLSRFLEFPLAPLAANRKTDEIHHQLSLFMPESAADEHIVRAESICQQGSRWAATTLLELVLFFYSNHLDMSGAETRRAADSRVLQLIDFFDKVGPVLQILQRTEVATAQALLDRFFASAVRLGRVDALRRLVGMGLDVRSRARNRIKNFELDDTIAPIDIALRAGDVDMVDFLLDQGVTFVFVTGDEAARNGPLSNRSLNSALHRYAVPGAAHSAISLVDRVFRAQPDNAYPEAELVRYLDCMPRESKNKYWRAAALPILDCLWAIEQSSVLQNPLAALTYAIRFGHRKMVVALVARMPDLDAAWHGNLGDTVMAEAAWAADYEVCEMLLCHGASPDPNPMPVPSLSALQIAAFRGDAQLAALLVKKGANVNYRHSSPYIAGCATAVGAALRQEHVELVELLLDHDADISADDLTFLEALAPSGHMGLIQRVLCRGDAFTSAALVEAVRQSDLGLASLLVEVGAGWDCENEQGETPLALAQSLGYRSIASHILDADPARYDPAALLAATCSATPTGSAGSNSSVFEVLFARRGAQNCPADAWGRFLEGLTLAAAVCLGDENAVLLLVQAGVRLLKNPRAPRARFLNRFALGGTTCEVFGVGPESAYDYTLVIPGATLLGTACLAEQPAMVRLLVHHGYRPNHIDLALAARKLDLDIVKLLLAAADLPNGAGKTWRDKILARLIYRGWASLVHSLLDHGADVNTRELRLHIPTGRRLTPLQAAILVNDTRLVRRLLLLGADVNTPTIASGSATPLQLAAGKGNIGIARLLVESGADCTAPAPKFLGKTALENAAENGRIDMIQYLLSQGARTDGAHRHQYFRAIRLAEAEGHHFAAKMLKQWREWSDEDAAVFSTVDADDDLEGVYADEASLRHEDYDEECDGMQEDDDTDQHGCGGKLQGTDPVGRRWQQVAGSGVQPEECESASQAAAEDDGLVATTLDADFDYVFQDFELALPNENLQNWPAAGAERGEGVTGGTQEGGTSAEDDGGQFPITAGGAETWEQLVDWDGLAAFSGFDFDFEFHAP